MFFLAEKKNHSNDNLTINFFENSFKIKKKTMENEIALSSIVQDPKKASYISSSKITLNYCEIQLFDKVPHRFSNITKLFLSHNKISTLAGIEQFKFLTHLSIGYNHIEDYRELNHILNKENLKYLTIQGNPLENHPNHKILLLEIFPNLEKLDDLKIDKNFRVFLEKKTSFIQKNFITFLYFLYDEINNLEILLTKLKISNELKTFKLEEVKQQKDINAQEKLNEFMNSDKTLVKFKKLFNFQRIEELKDFLQTRKFPLKTDFFSILANISEILFKLYGSFDNVILNNRQAFFTIYKCLYLELIEKLNKRVDKNLEHFLVTKILSNDLICKRKFSEDEEYALDCMLSVFYQLLPTQAFISNVICYDKKNELLSPTKEYFKSNDQFYERGFSNLSPDNLSNRIYKWEHGKEIWKYKRNEIINNLEINENNPENIKNVLLIHFPIFPLNKNYMESLLEILNNKFNLLLSFYSQILQILDVPINLKPPVCHPINNKTIQNSLENEFLQKSLETLRNKEIKKTQDKEVCTNTNEDWNKRSTMKMNKFEQNNQIFSFEKTQTISKKNKNQKNVSLKKSIIRRIQQETATNYDLNNLNLQKIKRNFIFLTAKVLNERWRDQLKWSFELFKKNSKLKKQKQKQFLIKKKKCLENFCKVMKKFIKNSKENNKKKGFRDLLKHNKNLKKMNLFRKIKLRRIFNILFENFVDKKKKLADFYGRMLKYRVFFHFLKVLYNKKKAKDTLSFLINFCRKKYLNSGWNKWKKINSEKKRFMIKNDDCSELSREKNFNKEAERNENYNCSNLNNNFLGDSKSLLKKQMSCKCKHYFRKCGACESVSFN